MLEFEGWNYIALECVGSTNDEAKKYCLLPNKKTVIRANKQTAGRGRRGRSWISETGNLFCSLVLEFELQNPGNLVLICSLSMAQTLEKFLPQIKPQLKWPNDVLLMGKKVSGILLEKGEGNYIIVGIGVNIASAPKTKNLIYETTSLLENGISCTAEKFLKEYLKNFNQNLRLLEKGKKNDLMSEWLKRAYGIGKRISVCRDNGEEQGIFSGIDDDMALLLKQDKKIIKILAGDVFFENGDKNGRI